MQILTYLMLYLKQYEYFMKKVLRIFIILFIITDVFLLGKILLTGKNVQVLNPKGYIALQEQHLIFLAIGIMLIAVIPVFAFAIYVARKYHEDNTKAKYTPDWNHNTKLQVFYWGFLLFIMSTLSVVCWVSAHQLDPHNALVSSKKPLVIQVVAMQWKWLFIYPEQRIATINYIAFPEKTPVTFEITGMDSPMNSFWIPQLGGQIYAMSGMATQTHLIANGIDTYRGSSAEIDGAGFGDMRFTAQSLSQSDFDAWVGNVKQSTNTFNFATATALANPNDTKFPAYYTTTDDNLYTEIVTKDMAKTKNAMQGMGME